MSSIVSFHALFPPFLCHFLKTVFTALGIVCLNWRVDFGLCFFHIHVLSNLAKWKLDPGAMYSLLPGVLDRVFWFCENLKGIHTYGHICVHCASLLPNVVMKQFLFPH